MTTLSDLSKTADAAIAKGAELTAMRENQSLRIENAVLRFQVDYLTGLLIEAREQLAGVLAGAMDHAAQHGELPLVAVGQGTSETTIERSDL